MKEYKVVFAGWEGYDCDDEPYFTGTHEECEEWINIHTEDYDLAPDEWFEAIPC